MSSIRSIPKITLFLLFSSLAAQIVSAATFERDISREFFNQSGKELIIDTGAGDINVRSGDSDSTLIQVKISVKASSQEKADEIFDKIDVDISESGSGTKTRIRRNKSVSFLKRLFGAKKPSVEVYAICPKISDLVLDTGSGGIFLSGVEGQIVLDTGSGHIQGENLAGDLKADTGSGTISLKQVKGSFLGDTGSGNIRILDLDGSFIGDTGSGSIHAQGQISSFTADSGSGSIIIESLFSDPGPSSVETGSGNINLYLPAETNAQFKGTTGAGSVTTDFPIDSAISKSRKSLQLVLNSGGSLISARSGAGDISLKIANP